MRRSSNRSEYKRGIDEDELSWTSHHFRVWRHQCHSFVHSTCPLLYCYQSQSRPCWGLRMLVIRRFFGVYAILGSGQSCTCQLFAHFRRHGFLQCHSSVTDEEI